MGRDLRRVPPNWEHPKKREYNPRIGHAEMVYHPMRDQPFESAAREWLDACIAWDNGTDPDAAEHKASHPFYWMWNGTPPDPEYYRPAWANGLATWFQMYETVSEGTPVTPPFATREELIEYLVANGDFWDQKRRAEGRGDSDHNQPWERASAERFVNESGWAPSLVMQRTGDDVQFKTAGHGL